MSTFGRLVDKIIESERAVHLRQQIMSELQDSYYHISKEYVWAELKEEADLDMTDADDSTGLWLPANMASVKPVVWDLSNSDNPIRYYYVDEELKERSAPEYLYRFYFSDTLKEPGWSGRDLTLTERAASFSVGVSPIANTITVTDAGSGSLTLTIGESTNLFTSGDTVIVTGTTDYNASYTATAADSTTITVTGTYVSDQTGYARTTSTLVGEYARFATEPGFYRITSEDAAYKVFGISPAYLGPSIDGNQGDATSSYSIRPAGTKKLAVLDSDGDFDDDADLTVYFSQYPPPLYEGNQVILLPSDEPLRLRALSVLAGSITARDSYARQYDEALGKMKSMSPDFGKIGHPKDIHHEDMFSNMDLYVNRETATTRTTYSKFLQDNT